MEPIAYTLFFLIVCLLCIAGLPVKTANAHSQAIRRLVTTTVGLVLLTSLALAATYLTLGSQPFTIRLANVSSTFGLHLGIYYDGATSLMLLLVSFVGFVVSRFSIRHLDGETGQGRYFRWLAFNIGSVALMVVAGNLLLFFAAWVMTSWGLHQLLLHYRHRPAAHRAAWTKFAISRLGDAFLIGALALILRNFGTFDLHELFPKITEAIAANRIDASQAAIAWLLMLGAITKSAQFPFHIWLPDTMETPTPVSALMHAGIVNGGGYLIIRLSPLFQLAPESLLTLASIGAFTACFASVVMMTQPSVKRALAYSTIAQMGFMMLQCGMGAFSAAMLHIIAHSLYKAHAFLSSGNVVSQSRSTYGATVRATNRLTSAAALLVAASASITAYLMFTFAADIQLNDKPGASVLSLVLLLALTVWGWQVLTSGYRQTAIIGLTGIAGLCLVYVIGYAWVDHLLRPNMPKIDFPPASRFVLAGIATGFALLFLLHIALRRSGRSAWLAPLRVHANNGFYIDASFHRIIATVTKS